MMNASVVTIKGQIVIPAEIRRKTGIRKGTKVFLEEKNGDVIIHPATSGFYEQTCGILKGGGLTKMLLTERRKEKDHEEAKFAKK